MKHRQSILLAGIAILFASSAIAASGTDWICRNTEMEISCSSGVCSSSKPGEFTPMNVSLKAQTLSVCAYSGCWDGKATTLVDGPLVYAHGRTMKWSGADKSHLATFQLAVNVTSKLAVLLGEGFAHPMHCNLTD